VLGLGNDILTDDGVGLAVLRMVRDRIEDKKLPVDFVETNEMGLSLLDFLEGYEHAIIIDSILTGKRAPGTVEVFDRGTFDNPAACNPHHMGLDEILDLAEKVKIRVPKTFDVVAIEVKDPFSFGEKLSPELEKVLPKVVTRVVKLIDKALKRYGKCTSTASPK
jgi:hydrogenase maturation protease